MIPTSITYGDLKAHATVVPIWNTGTQTANVWRVEFYFAGRCVKMVRVNSEEQAERLAERFRKHMDEFKFDL